jgi:hypothetical protein
MSTDIPIVTDIANRIAFSQHQTCATDNAKFEAEDGTVCVQSRGVSTYGANAAPDLPQIWKCLRGSMERRVNASRNLLRRDVTRSAASLLFIPL